MHNDRRAVTARPVRLAVLCALLAMQPVAAWSQPTGARYQVDQPAQPLSEVLKAIASQTNISVLFDAAVVGKRLSKPVAGQFTGAEAISKALEGSGLTAEVMRDGSVVVKPSAESGTGTSDADTTKASTEREGAQKLPTVEVTGSRIKRVETDTALPVNVYTRQDIDRSGQSTLGGFLSSLNEVSLIAQEGTDGTVGAQGTVQLRGLPLGTTLVLINGRRTQAAGSSTDSSFFNLDLIPFAAIERIEILPVGSSAVYGGDALAGVVNIILRKAFDGWAIDTHYGAAKGTEDGSLSLLTGNKFDRGSFLLLGSFSKRTPLNKGERDFFKDADYRRFGGPDARSQSCVPGTVSSTTTANLPGLNFTLAGIPTLAPGASLTTADFVPTAGVPNLCSASAQGHGFGLLWGSETAALHAAGDFHLGRSWSTFAEVTYAELRQSVRETGVSLTNVLVPASNAFNPFGVPVRVTGRLGLENSERGFIRNSDYSRAVVGARAELWSRWDLEASVSTTRDKSESFTLASAVNPAALTAALASSSPSTALNPFTAGRAASDEVLRGIWSDFRNSGTGVTDSVDALLRGPAFELPTGTVDLLIGGERRRDGWTFTSGPALPRDLSRQSHSLFGETRVPILARSSGAGRGSEYATLTLAGRHDSYDKFGDADTYQAGLELRPVRTLLLRAATATSFKPPTLFQAEPLPQTFATEVLSLRDPLNGNAPIVGGIVAFGPNPNLESQTGKARTLGVVWEPDFVSGLRLGMTAWELRLREYISLPTRAQFFLDNEALFPGYVTRGPSTGGTPGPVTGVLWTYVNFGKIDVSGTDVEASYAFIAAPGKWNLSASATRTTKYKVLIVPGSPTTDRLSKLNTDFWAPKLKGRVSVGLDTGPWGAGFSGRYVGSYKDAGTSTRELGDLWYIDLSASVDLKKASSAILGGFKGAVLSASVVNAGNKRPEFANTSFFYDFTQSDWRGRYYSARLSIAF